MGWVIGLLGAAIVLAFLLRKGEDREPDLLDEPEEGVPQSVDIPIDGVLDLHNFHPRDTRTLIPDYLQACQQKGIHDVRIIHGKGTGALRKSVHALLDRSPLVEKYNLGDQSAGSWGATVVVLKRD